MMRAAQRSRLRKVPSPKDKRSRARSIKMVELMLHNRVLRDAGDIEILYSP